MLVDYISTRQDFVIQEEVMLLSSEHLFHGHFYKENSNCTGKSLQNKTANKMCGSQFFSSQSPNKVKPTLLNSHFTHIITILISIIIIIIHFVLIRVVRIILLCFYSFTLLPLNPFTSPAYLIWSLVIVKFLRLT